MPEPKITTETAAPTTALFRVHIRGTLQERGGVAWLAIVQE